MKQLFIGSICMVITFGILSCGVSSEALLVDPMKDIDSTEYNLDCLESIYKRKTFKRYDKTFSEYVRSEPNKPDSVRKIIYILPLGNMNPEIERIIKDEVAYLKVFFQLDVRILERVSFEEIKNKNVTTRLVPSDDYNYYTKLKGQSANLREQIDAKSLIEKYIKNNVPDSAVAVVGITEQDLYLPNMNYIFGVSYLKERVGLISTYRITENIAESKMNIRKVATKQIANLFSIPNVKDYECVLNYHNDINELRGGVFYISPKALEKLRYAIQFDYDTRFSMLGKFYREENNAFMEEYYNKCLELRKKHK